MSVLTPTQVYAYALGAGFSPEQAVTFTAIAMAESGLVTTANAAGTEDSRGLWQINVSEGVRPNYWGDLYDPAVNARAAYEVSEQGTDIGPWSVTHDNNRGTSRDYRSRLDEAHAAAAEFARNPDAFPMAMGAVATDNGLVGQPVTDAVLTDTWGAARSGGRTHEGIDIFADEGTPIHAVVGGTVGDDFDSSLGGNVVRIHGDDGRDYYYAHVKDDSTTVEGGQRVEAGEVIAEVGDTGNAQGTSPHLHLGIYVDGDAINPYPLLVDVPNFGDLPMMTDPYDIDPGLPPQLASPIDTDQDTITDQMETLLHTDANSADSDGDRLTDSEETVKYHTNPMAADTDGDGVGDADEIAAGTDAGTERLPIEALKAGFIGGRTLHTDADGLSDLYEVQNGTDPFSTDSDADGLNDDLELARGWNPSNIDANSDGLVDSSPLAPPSLAFAGPRLSPQLGGPATQAGYGAAAAQFGAAGSPLGADGAMSPNGAVNPNALNPNALDPNGALDLCPMCGTPSCTVCGNAVDGAGWPDAPGADGYDGYGHTDGIYGDGTDEYEAHDDGSCAVH